MNYPRSEKYNTPALQAMMMGPNPIKLEEELLTDHRIPQAEPAGGIGRDAESQQQGDHRRKAKRAA